jgi:hypothetical protein
MRTLKTNSDTSSVSVGGEQYEVIDGYVDVPDHLADDLLPHGFFFADRPMASQSEPVKTVTSDENPEGQEKAE